MILVRGNSNFVIAIFLIAIAVVFPVPGMAQQITRGEFSLPHDVRWENSVLPRGDYIYYVDSTRWPALVRVEQKGGGFSGVFVPQGLMRPGRPGGSGINLGALGDGAYVISLDLQGLGGELFFSAPATETEKQPADPVHEHTRETDSAGPQTHGNLTILNPNHEKVSFAEAEKVYLRVCEAIEKEFSRTSPIRPRLVVRLGANDNVLRYPMGEIQLKKWDEYRFADGVLDLAMHYMMPPDERVRLSNAAVHEAAATVNICELKTCVN